PGDRLMRSKTLTWALIASAALNLFLVGVIAGGLGVHASRARPRAASPVRRAGLNLDTADRRRLIAVLHAEGAQVRPAVARAREIRRAAWTSLAAPAVDPAQVKSELGTARQLEVSSRAEVEEAVVDFAAGLAPGERAAFAGAVGRAMPPPIPAKARPAQRRG
ncbi:MAG: periplasmic heavy metal sensor, partial [Caulobacteraceae bacterium]